MLTKKEYDKLMEQQKKASATNNYSTMIMMGSPEANAMQEYEQSICKHPDIGTDGGGDYCKICAKRWDR